MSRKPRDTKSEEGFLQRWSARKQANREAPESASEAAVEPPPTEAAETEPVELPDVDSLTINSDFTVFLREGVPEALRRQALRRLWRLSPTLANLDGLNDYDLDYTDKATVVEGLKSAWQAGRGYLDREPEKRPEPERALAEETHGVEEEEPEEPEETVAEEEPRPAAKSPEPAGHAEATPPRRPARKRRWSL